MILHPVAVAPDVDDVAVVHKAVDESRRHDLVAEHATPVCQTAFNIDPRSACKIDPP